MSFAQDVRNDLSRLESQSPAEDKAELVGLLKMSGSIVVRNRYPGIKFITDSAALARRVIRSIKNYYSVQTQIMVMRAHRLQKKTFYQVLVLPSQEAAKALQELQLLTLDEEEPKNILQTNAARQAFLRGAFLGGGSVNSPTSKYHLELLCDSMNFAKILLGVMWTLGVRGKAWERNGKYVVYLKKSDEIITFLGLIGAHGAVLELENSRLLRDIRQKVNRQVNCETANLGKTARAAALQIRAIHYVEDHYGFSTLPKKIRDAAKIRLQLPEAALGELCEHFGKISRSSMSIYLKRVVELAFSLGMDKNDDEKNF